LESFPAGSHDDQVDALSGAFEKVTGGGPSIIEI
jgi:phage terminase large subunit-like protein